MKVLLISESINNFDSGGKVVRYLAKVLISNNVKVRLVVLKRKSINEADNFNLIDDIVFLPIRSKFYFRIYSIFFNTKEIRAFQKILKNYTPDIVHFASFENSKPSKLISESKKAGSKVVLQPWTMHFFCSQGFGFKNNQICTKCANGNYLSALYYNCSNIKGIPGLIERFFLHKRALRATTLLSSNSTLNSILVKYGISEKNIFNFPVPFDCYTEVEENINTFKLSNDKDYYIYYGQVNEHKGLKVLKSVFEKLPNIKLKVYPMSFLEKDSIPLQNVEIINGVSWANGLKEAIVNSRGVVIPSLWVTSTEYSLCEALFLKKPVILFNVGIHKDLFLHKFNAMVVNLNDIDSFVNAIIELENDSKLRLLLSINGYNTLIKHNRPEKLFNEMMSAYKN